MFDKKLTSCERRRIRVKAKIIGTQKRPRLSVFRANKYIYAQIIDDSAKKTLVMVSEKDIKNHDTKKTKTEKAAEVGQIIAKRALDQKISSVVFDRGSSKYHGRVKALADGARTGGLQF